MIEIERVTKRFGDKVAVDDLSLTIPSGELFAVLGQNGAGKTTTIKMIAGLLRPTAGRVRVCGLDVLREPLAAKALLAYVPDEPFLYDKLTGREFLHFIADMYRLGNGAPRRTLIESFIEMFDMVDYVDELSEAYSHGMKQRLVLAATLLHRPKVVVVDEPLVGLDPQNARRVKDIFRDEARKGTTIFMSTHIVSVAEEIADRIGIIRDGRIVALGTMAELRVKSRHDGKLEEVFFRILENGDGDAADGAIAG